MPEAIQPVDRRLWWPEAHCDEVMPAGRTTPDAWLYRLTDDTHGCEGDEGQGVAPLMLTEGQVVPFTWCDRLGTARVSHDEEGRAVWSPKPPAAANNFWIAGDIDSLCDTADTFAEMVAEHFHGEETATVSEWGDTVRCRFTALDGPPRFVPLDRLPGDPAEAVAATDFDPHSVTASLL